MSGASNITVTIGDKDYTATVVGEDSTSDIAVIKVDADGLTPAIVGDSDKLAVGDNVLAVGNPLGELGGTVTSGIVSALNRSVSIQSSSSVNTMSLIQMDASVSPGNSGGGLFNMNGELIGIVNAKSSSSDAEGLGFAIPINDASRWRRTCWRTATSRAVPTWASPIWLSPTHRRRHSWASTLRHLRRGRRLRRPCR